MRLLSIALASLAFVRATSAQYFSEGWKPGKPVTQAKTGFSYQPAPTQTAGTPDPASHSVKKSFFDLSTYLEAEPMKALFGRAGVNITEKLEAARREADNLWNSKIPLLTDDNYSNIVLEEKFNSLEEERDRLWFIVMSVIHAQSCLDSSQLMLDNVARSRLLRETAFLSSLTNSLTKHSISLRKLMIYPTSVGEELTI